MDSGLKLISDDPHMAAESHAVFFFFYPLSDRWRDVIFFSFFFYFIPSTSEVYWWKCLIPKVVYYQDHGSFPEDFSNRVIRKKDLLATLDHHNIPCFSSYTTLLPIFYPLLDWFKLIEIWVKQGIPHLPFRPIHISFVLLRFFLLPCFFFHPQHNSFVSLCYCSCHPIFPRKSQVPFSFFFLLFFFSYFFSVWLFHGISFFFFFCPFFFFFYFKMALDC